MDKILELYIIYIQGLLVLIDFENAIASVSWSLIYKASGNYGFGNSIIDMIKILKKDFKAFVL